MTSFTSGRSCSHSLAFVVASPQGPGPLGVSGLQSSWGCGCSLVHSFDPRKPKLTSTELQDVAQMKASCDYDTAYHNCFLACMGFSELLGYKSQLVGSWTGHHFARDVWNAVVVASLQCTHYPDRPHDLCCRSMS